jgi:hypothetical protein
MMGDFKTFYCAAKVTREEENPYEAAPLGRCELVPEPRPLYVPKPGLVLPAPLPGYAVAAFLPLTFVPFPMAAFLWFLVLSVATLASILLLSRIGSGDAWTIGVAFALPVIAISFVLGQVVPIAVFGVILTAYAARREPSLVSTILVGLGIVFSFAEPQAGVAVAFACALLDRRFAAAAGAAVAILALVAVATLGVRENLIYLREVLPAQLFAELPAYFQYSLSWAAVHLGMPASQAVMVGRLQWLTMLGVAATIARSGFAKQHPDGVVLAASALAVTGGPYAHLQHIALALPAALWIASLGLRNSRVATMAIVFLSLPMLQFFLMVGRTSPVLILAMFLVAGTWLGSVYGNGIRSGLIACAAIVCIILVNTVAFAMTGFGLPSTVPMPVIAPDIPEASWAHFVATHYAAVSPAVWLVKIPTWFGLVATAGSLVVAAWGYGKRKQLTGAINYAA